MKRRGTWLAGILLALTFSVGALGGMALEEALGIDWFEFLDEDQDRTGNSLLSGFDLSDQQKTRVDRILEDREEALEEYWEQRLPEIERIVAQSYAEIRLILTPEQQSTFDKRVRSLGGALPDEVRAR